jgi:F-type H+-transporting ATPase subunit b
LHEFEFPAISEILWAALNFVILYALLHFALYKPVLSMMDKREKEIADNLEGAAKANAEAAKMQQDLQAQLSQASAQAQDIVTKARQAAEADREATLTATRDEVDRMRERATTEIAREREAALSAIRHEVAELTIAAASKVVGRSLDSADHRRLAQEVVEGMGH